jgi:hypothetical protein
MSTEQDKIKKNKRIQKDENVIKKQTQIAKQHGSSVEEPHKFAKQHAMDCGNPKCLLCSRDKVLGIKSIKERRLEQDLDNVSDRRSNGLTTTEKK